MDTLTFSKGIHKKRLLHELSKFFVKESPPSFNIVFSCAEFDRNQYKLKYQIKPASPLSKLNAGCFFAFVSQCLIIISLVLKPMVTFYVSGGLTREARNDHAIDVKCGFIAGMTVDHF